MGKIDGVPAQRDQLARPQAMAVGDQDHGGVAVAIAVLASCRDQPIDLGVGQVLARADLGVAAPLRWSSLVNCPINGGRRHQRQMRFFHGFSGLFRCDCPINRLLMGHCASQKSADAAGATAIPRPVGEGSQGRETPKRRAFWRRCQRMLLASLLTGNKQAVLTGAG